MASPSEIKEKMVSNKKIGISFKKFAAFYFFGIWDQ